MYKMKAICDEHQGLISFIDECGCECGSVHYDIFKRVFKVDLSFESSFVHQGQKLTKQLIEKLAKDSAWESGIDDDLLWEGIEVIHVDCESFEERLDYTGSDDDIFNAWMKR